MTDNEALAEILESAQAIEEELLNPYEEVAGGNSQAVSDVSPYVRPANPQIIKAIVTNLGSRVVVVKEGGVIVAVLNPDQTWESPLAGNKEVQAACHTGESSTIAAADYLKSAP